MQKNNDGGKATIHAKVTHNGSPSKNRLYFANIKLI